MTGEIEAIGDIVTGGVLASSVETATGSSSASGTQCLNCGFILAGNHCHNCGQKARVHRTLSAFGGDILHSVLHFDGKIWRTLPLLAWYPGELTRRYVHGERAKFVSPIALFLFTVFLTFAVFNFMVPSTNTITNDTPLTPAEAAKELATDRASLQRRIAELEAKRAEALRDKESIGWMDNELARNRKLLTELELKRAPEVAQREVAARKFEIKLREFDREVAAQEARLSAAKKAGQPTQQIESDLQGLRTVRKTMLTATDLLSKKDRTDWKVTDLNFFGSDALNEAGKHALENPQLLVYKIQSNAYKFSWALIPISIPFVWLLFFWRREFKMFDHAVFVTYSLCFMMTLAMLGGLMLTFLNEDSFLFVLTILVLVFFPPIHMYRQIHRGYQTSRSGALWRTFALSQFALLALTLFVSLIFALGITG